MAVALIFENPHVTQEQYDAVRARLGVDADHPPEGALLHVGGLNRAGGWGVFEIWESEDAAVAFIEEQLTPVFEEHGRPPPVYRVWELHRVLSWLAQAAASDAE
jgi:hypothetical protein